MNARTLARLALGALAALLGLAPLALPSAAHAGQVAVALSITGAGRVDVVEGSLEDGGSYSCDRTHNLDHRVTLTCPRIRNEEPLEAWIWLRPARFGAPAGFEFVEWQGCDETRTNSIGTRDCAVHSGAFNSVEKYPHAIFRDTEPPTVTGFTATQQVNVQGQFRFAWTASGALRSECQLAAGDWEPCTSPRILTLPVGAHTFAVRAVDTSGNLSHTFSTQVFSLDTRFTATPPKLTNSRGADFAFTSEGSTSSDCTLDGQPVVCANGKAHLRDLPDGTHTLTVAGRNGSWVDPVPAGWEWTVDTTAPDAALVGGPVEGSTTTATTAEFTLLAPSAVAFACTIDGRPMACHSGVVRVDGLTPGRHVLEASARDEAGNWDPSPAVRTWTVRAVDTTAPDTTVTGGPEEGSIAVSPDATFGIGTTETGARVTCTLDGAALPCAPGPLALAGLAPGTHTLSVSSTDAAGNADPTAATRTWTVPAPASALKGKKGWKLRSVAGSFAGSALTAKRTGATATYAVTDARRLALVVSKGKAHGKIKVYAGKRLLRTVSLKGPAGTRQVVPVTTFGAPYTGAVRIVVASRGRTVRVEGIAAPTR
ncbi:hypothetical protein ACJ5H2_05165 [Nocardioides sp. R1-1]|uniref:hypothetical protein n=1 Tax=Nocardioides sp. R1-1 TaxID=3383502 RepID=UPI0038D1B500